MLSIGRCFEESPTSASRTQSFEPLLAAPGSDSIVHMKLRRRGFLQALATTPALSALAQRPGAPPRFFAAYGEELKKNLESYAGSCVTVSIYGERVARFENHVRIN